VRGYVPALDGIRGVAVTAVVLVHLGLFLGVAPTAPGWLNHVTGGQLGVDVFFVLSGALITSLLLGEQTRTGSMRLSSFYVRRLRRLGPALALTLTAVAAVAVTYGHDALGPHPWLTGVAVGGFFGNWLSANALGSLGWLSATWSLAVEEQFYLVWPVVLRTALRWRLRPREVTLGLVTALLFCQAYGVTAAEFTDPRRAYFHTPVRGVGLALGCLVAMLVHYAPTSRLARVLATTPLAALAGIGTVYAASQLGTDPRTLERGGYLLVDALAAIVIAHCFLRAGRRSAVTRVLAAPPLRGLGVISYGVYLFHVPVILGVVYAGRGHLSPSTQIVVDIVATIALATASYHLVERPIRRGRRRVISLPPMHPEPVATAVAID